MKVSSSSAEVMLMSWGQWQRGHPSLGFPRLSVLGRVILEGPGASHATVLGEAHMPWQVEITERCVLEMPKTIQRVCKHRFIGDEPDHVVMKKLRLTQGELEQRIVQACNILSDYLVETA